MTQQQQTKETEYLQDNILGIRLEYYPSFVKSMERINNASADLQIIFLHNATSIAKFSCSFTFRGDVQHSLVANVL